MSESFDIQSYMTHGVERVVADALRATFRSPARSAFMVKFAAASKKASQKRKELESAGTHIPPFLICSITSSCNLHCAGCYSRCNHATTDEAPVAQLTDEEWSRIFSEARETGVSFILLAGGEPLLRRGVIEEAGKRQDILFPIFTNGTFMNERYLDLFEKCRNLVPIMSIEGDRDVTDARRGAGVYDKLMANMDACVKRDILFGVSLTVTRENLDQVLSDEYSRMLAGRGCKVILFIEYVPVTEESKDLALTEEEEERLLSGVAALRERHEDLVYVSFPGDEKSSGGCIAAGRGFFHINSHGGAEPCPFSPYSDVNLRNMSLVEAMDSPLMSALRNGDLLKDDHVGGCVLYEKRAEVERLVSLSRSCNNSIN